MQMNVTAGKNSLVSESAAKEKIRRPRSVFPEWKGSYAVLLENEMPYSLPFSNQEDVQLCV